VKQTKNQQWALNEMAKWLSHSIEFGEKPVQQRIIYEREVSWPWQHYPVKVFLIEYRMKKGFEGIGFTGPTTWSFVAVDDWKAFTPEDWIYCYAGWYIQFFFIHPKGMSKKDSIEKAYRFVFQLIEERIINPFFFKVCDAFDMGEDLTYFVIEAIKDGEKIYIVGTEEDYIFYKKNLPQMQLPPLYYFLGKTFNPFREA
jgi:hypothetical protein